jgi:hypothetical protein
LNEIRLKSIFQLSSHMKSAKFMARGLVTERIFSLVKRNKTRGRRWFANFSLEI